CGWYLGVWEHGLSLSFDGGAAVLFPPPAIVAGAADHLAPDGWLLLEHHHDQSEAVLALLAEAGLMQGCAHPDLEGKLRFAAARAAS
ncbi:MAG: protein-(glutamine-N5) methyltransferase, release factor-specific, partial [Cyanobacteriota bacterium]